MIKTAILSLSASALLFSLGAMAITHAPRQAPMVEGKEKPILLQRVVVTATLLPS